MKTDQTYEITLTKTASVPLEIAQTDFMTEVFKLADTSNLIGHGIEITKREEKRNTAFSKTNRGYYGDSK
jgi:hypothetical protein